ncbi:MAG: MotA/TolQ/ExbB proton channel family protein [Polyangiaceae bacterium]|nr:MotA/TolQ/ExbB proton channel family protein [Polyangiaceae bacterium]
MLGATWVMWLLVALSVVCVAIMLERAYYLFSGRDDIQSLRIELRKLLGAGDVEGAKKRLASSKAYEAQVVHAALEGVDHGPDSVEETLHAETALAKARMERNLAFLGTVGNNAPFVGLLGTVIGIIRAFHELNQSAGEVTSGLMAEVGEALVATAIGLLVALPAVASYNFFQRLVKNRLTWTGTLGSEVLAYAKSTVHGSAKGAK